jgi:hypothetical protein
MLVHAGITGRMYEVTPRFAHKPCGRQICRRLSSWLVYYLDTLLANSLLVTAFLGFGWLLVPGAECVGLQRGVDDVTVRHWGTDCVAVSSAVQLVKGQWWVLIDHLGPIRELRGNVRIGHARRLFFTVVVPRLRLLRQAAERNTESR